ncbi:glycoside hydrolase family 3 N-terminal domain-containing protein [Campylobacter sp.]|uniref:glycoside hydrolase family 3 N-terminal domain-containing protein n=1 Tax=Campylobacter sp. TaxID=205 RepID=UPI0026F482CB|nr:glycoside hydrolase family 3 N-terminal domain-containing protein [Campylobacter sp.]
MKKFFSIFFSVLILNSLVFADEKPTLRKMISQMIMVSFSGATPTEAKDAISDAKYRRFGGVMLLGKNIKDKQTLIKLTSEFKTAQKDIFIAIDEEGGDITRLKDKEGFKTFISAAKVAKSLDLLEAKELYKNMAVQLKEAGINLNFAPVVDVLNPVSPIIASKSRAFSENIDEVSLYASEFLDAFNEVGVLTTLKHFPGHGSAEMDSHNEKTVIENFNYDELKPYYDAIKKDQARLIMISHVYLNEEDSKNPASLSPKIINELLRKKLKFQGVVISDDMLMGGLKGFSLEQKVINFINAGGDILLFSDFRINGQRTAQYITQIVVDAVSQNKISKERIKESYERIMSLKKSL